MGVRRHGAAVATCALALGVLAGCGSPLAAGDQARTPGASAPPVVASPGPAGAKPGADQSGAAAKSSPSTGTSGSSSSSSSAPLPSLPKDVQIDAPGKLSDSLLSSDVLIYSQDTLATSTVDQIKAIKGVSRVEPISMGSFFADEREVTYAAVNPSTFRRFTTPGTAQTDAVWARVAGGEIAVEPSLAKQVADKDGYVRVGNDADAPRIHIGAFAQMLDPAYARHIDAVVNYKWADKLGMRKNNALLVAMPTRSPQSVRTQLQKYAGAKASVQILGPDLDINAVQTAFLTGGSVAAAVGSFSYRGNPDGSVTPDPAWVARSITTETMPIIGSVTGNRVMLPQLRAALLEVVARGLSSKIYHYDGCYVPRFIGHDPSKGLSFHSFGTAIDLNAADNARGGPGKMDRTVVSIFKKWGFAWGGDWRYTDPMHFELASLVTIR